MSAENVGVGRAEQRRFVNIAAAITATGGLLFGYDTGVISGALLFIKHDYALSSLMQGLIVSLLLVGAVVGALSGGQLADRFGRRWTALLAAIIFGLGALAAAFTPSVGFLLFARFLLGLGVGLASLVVPLYIAEIAPRDTRGALVSLNQLMITVGILVSYLIGVAFTPIEGWRWMFGLAVIPAVILGGGMFLLPESPRWLFEHDLIDRARAVLSRTRSEAEVEQEIQEIQAIKRQEEQQEQVGYRELLAPFLRPALIVGVGLAIFQQVTGINTVIYYAPTILQSTGFSAGTAIAATSVGVGLVNVGFTVLAVWLIDRVGRKPLLFVGLIGMIVALFVLGLVFALGAAGSTLLGVLATLCLALYIASFAISLGPVFWLMISEIYPLNIRGKAMSVASLCNWGSNFIVSLTFLLLVNALGQTGTFWIYAAIGILAWIFIYFLVPETKGRSLEEIEASFRGTTIAPAPTSPPPAASTR